MLCLLSPDVANTSSVYEVNGNPIKKHKGYLAFKFEDYNCTVEYYRGEGSIDVETGFDGLVLIPLEEC
ncbi:unnamed protein product [Linum trigynum]|uniref:Uncharacterized protein n=1 Tax=Linum trigynum TaxID=586398 RepID=A0AAV2DU90_9ROSI